MAWTHYRLKFRLLSPLHVGYRKVSNLMQTRRYVPGKNLWAALTARITRDEYDGSRGSAYQCIGDLVRQHVCCGYLWPSLDGREPYLPWKHDDFDYLLLDSYAGTALDYDRAAALDGSLRETEFIAPTARDDGRRPVYLLGNLWVREALPADLSAWKKALQRLQLGGERGYGWGRMQLETDLSLPGKPSEPTHVVRAGETITAHTLAVDTNGAKAVPHIEGALEPITGWERDNSASGRTWRLASAVITYMPGARVQRDVHIRVGPLGIWEAAA